MVTPPALPHPRKLGGGGKTLTADEKEKMAWLLGDFARRFGAEGRPGTLPGFLRRDCAEDARPPGSDAGPTLEPSRQARTYGTGFVS